MDKIDSVKAALRTRGSGIPGQAGDGTREQGRRHGAEVREGPVT